MSCGCDSQLSRPLFTLRAFSLIRVPHPRVIGTVVPKVSCQHDSINLHSSPFFSSPRLLSSLLSSPPILSFPPSHSLVSICQSTLRRVFCLPVTVAPSVADRSTKAGRPLWNLSSVCFLLIHPLPFPLLPLSAYASISLNQL